MPNPLHLAYHLGRLDLPQLYQTEKLPDSEKIIKAHLFTGPLDVYVAEYDPDQGLVFALTGIAGQDYELSWGYQSVTEMAQNQVEFDLHWQPITAQEAKDKWLVKMGLKEPA